MAEVAIAAVEAVFDWRSYLKENFPEQYGAKVMSTMRMLLYGEKELQKAQIMDRIDAWYLWNVFGYIKGRLPVCGTDRMRSVIRSGRKI